MIGNTVKTKSLWFCSTALASVPGALLVAGLAASPAHAVPSYAYATLQFTHFTLSGVVAVTGGGTVTGIPNETTYNATLTGVTVQDAAQYLSYPGVSNTSTNGNLATGATVAQAYSGPGPTPSSGAGSYGQQLGQSPTFYTGTRGESSISSAITSNATSLETSEGYLPTNGVGSSSTNTSTTIVISVIAKAGTTFTLSFNATQTLMANIGGAGDKAIATTSAVYDIKKGGSLVYNAQDCTNDPTYCAEVAALNGSGTDINLANPLIAPVTHTNSFNGITLSYTVPVSATGTYTLTLDSGTSENLTGTGAIPEPATLAMLGTSLVGMSMIRRRRRRQ